MGSIYYWKCQQCGYGVEVSGGPDGGFFCATNTFQCDKCKKLMDATTASWKDGIVKEKENFHCGICGSLLKVWDSEKKPCPCCGSTLQGEGPRMLWD
jgi:hypothetical protein